VYTSQPRAETEVEWETHMAVNHLGGHYLLQLLWRSLAEAYRPIRVVVTASEAHRLGDARRLTDDMHLRAPGAYSQLGAYAQSKLANVLWVAALADRLPAHVTPLAVHPGVIRTGLVMNAGGCVGAILRLSSDKNEAQGAATTLAACLDPALSMPAARGGYLVNCKLSRASRAGVDAEQTHRNALWEASERDVAAALKRLAAVAAHA
jgi:NAD(P)-dependent dehydrogenase (short-subunit alcohol dehydrogenase family)